MYGWISFPESRGCLPRRGDETGGRDDPCGPRRSARSPR